jgi:CRP-like cAMP-binding protein
LGLTIENRRAKPQGIALLQDRLRRSMASILDYCRAAQRRDFAAGATLVTQGETTGHLLVLAAGQVEVLRDQTQVATVAEPGAIFGEMSILLNRPHTATVRALSPVSVFVFDDAASSIRSDPEITLFISRLLAQRLNLATTYLVDLKRQFAEHDNHLGMVGDVLETLIHQQDADFVPGPEEDGDSRL